MPKAQHPRMLIGLHGLAGVGESTCAEILCQLLELRGYAIAQPIYEACAAALGMSLEQFRSLPKNHALDTLGCTKRVMMQGVGDALLEHDPRMLITSCEVRMAINEGSNNLFNGNLVEDIRTEAEADWVRHRDGLIVHIHNSRAPQAPEHRTEAGIAVRSLDLVIKNEGTLAELDTKLKHLAGIIRLEYGYKKAS